MSRLTRFASVSSEFQLGSPPPVYWFAPCHGCCSTIKGCCQLLTHCFTASCEGCSTRLISKTHRSRDVLESLDIIATTSCVTAPVSNHATPARSLVISVKAEPYAYC